MEKGSLVNLDKFLYVIRKRAMLMVLIAVITATVVAVTTIVFVTPEYSSTAKLYVNSTQDQRTYITQSDLTVAKSLVDTYIVIIKSDSALEKAAEVAGVSYTPEKIRGELTAKSISNTEAFSVTVTDKNPDVALAIANAIVEIAPEEILRVVEAGSVSIIDNPKLATEANDIGTKRNAIVGFIVGFAAAFALLFFLEVMDVTIYSEEDIENKFDYPIIGTIPSISSFNEIDRGKKEKSKKEKRRKEVSKENA